MDSTRRISIATGVLLIVATAAAIAAAAVLPALEGKEYLEAVSRDSLRTAASALGYVLAAAANVGIAGAVYPLLKRTHAALARGAVAFHTIETVFYAVGVVCLLAIGNLTKKFLNGWAPDVAATHAIAGALGSIRDHSSAVAVFAFCIGAFMYSLALYQTRLVPRWLSGWGMIAVVLMGVAVVLAVVADKPITGYGAIAAPIGVQQLVLAVWLLVRGFGTTEVVKAAT